MQSAALSQSVLQQTHKEHRRFQRVRVNLLGRFMLENRREYPCQTIDMSPGSAALMTETTGSVGEKVVAYIDHVGRIEGTITRVFRDGFAMSVGATARKRDKLASQLTWLANRHELNLAEDRRHERFVPKIKLSKLTMPDESELTCRIIEVSLSGASAQIQTRPEMGTAVTLAGLRGRIVRHTEDGVALEFATVQTEESLRQRFEAVPVAN
jgi:hypothetical protein